MIDPVCGMTVDPKDSAAAWEHEGTTFYFCSVACMERFRQEPERFLGLGDDQRSM